MKIPTRFAVLFNFILFSYINLFAQETEIQYLSGTGYDQTVNWQFYCTAGRNSGNWTSIPVPSNWELQGFGKYNYGHDKDSLRGKEQGLYKYTFKLPATWINKQVNIVFEGSMTDTEVKINGISAGPIHQGSFYRFKYDISNLLKYSEKNVLEVTVSKHSTNESVNKAERKCDFWIFGGIFRPVYLEALPKSHISKVAIDAKADGLLKVNISTVNHQAESKIRLQVLTLTNEKVGKPVVIIADKSGTTKAETHILKPKLWSPETPNLYKLNIQLIHNGVTLHQEFKKFGFRTVELRQRDGFYVNSVKIKFKGICRHSFWPSSGRTTSKGLSIADAELIKDMNMNAVRMSHYPPDEHFLDVCDSLGLFVLNELTGWHNNYDTKVGTQLVKEMVARDINHPCVVAWDNGNEGGHNFDLDEVFLNEDIQKRPVIQPWQVYGGIDAQHYINYDYGNGNFFHGHDVFFPTEFLHGLYDGGLGAGLYDYWEAMWAHPLSAGGFLWVFSDEGVIRTDKNGILDTDGSHAPDGIVGPYREKEGSYFAIKEIWSPVKFEQRKITPEFNGVFTIENRYFYTNLIQCSFNWKFVNLNSKRKGGVNSELTGVAKTSDVKPGEKGKLSIELPKGWESSDVLYIEAYDTFGKRINTWSWPVKLPVQVASETVPKSGTIKPGIMQKDSILEATSGNLKLQWNQNTGLLSQIENSKGIIPFNNGPVLCEGVSDFEKYTFSYDSLNLVIKAVYGKISNFKSSEWTVFPSGWVKLTVEYFPTDYESSVMGISFSYPENLVKSVTWMGNGPYRVWKNRMQGTTLNIWDKNYNNTVTGESQKLIYPEFKGYFSNLYWVKLNTTQQPITFVTESEDVFLRLFTPQNPKEVFNIAPIFPSGDISFMHGIPAIGTKSQKPENMGPSGKKNMYFDYWKARTKSITLYFNFNGE